jgi:hypothetical protein
MRRLLRKYADAVYVLLTAIDVLAAAVIVDRINNSQYLPWGLASTILLGTSIVVHVVLYRDTSTISAEAQNQVLGNVLEIAAKSLVFPESWEVIAIRAYCHRFDHKERTLHYVTSRASQNFDDQFTDIPVDAVHEDGRRVFVIAEAVVTGGTVFRDLPETRCRAELEAHVWSNIRSVLASPVYAMNATRCESSCIGVVSFDTSKAGADKIELNGRRASDVIMEVAATASLLWS